MTGPVDQVALLRFQLREVQQHSQQLQENLNSRAMLVFTDVVNALNYVAAAGQNGDSNAREAAKALVNAFDGARKVAESKIIVPPGTRYAARSEDGEETPDVKAEQEKVAGE
jgi:hypothetical protein